MEAGSALTLTDENFEQEVLSFPGVVLVDFWASWCGPCRAMAPFVEALAEKYKDDEKIKVAKLNVDENGAVSEKYLIRSIPTTIAFSSGTPAVTLVGLHQAEDLEKIIQEASGKLSVQKG